MAKLNNILGQKINRLTILERRGSNNKNQALWLCQCECGIKKTLSGYHITNNIIRSCGCLKKEVFLKMVKSNQKSPLSDGGEKKCTMCNIFLPIINFSKDKTKPHGIRPQCKKCHLSHLKNMYHNGGGKERQSIRNKHKRKNDVEWNDKIKKQKSDWNKTNSGKVKEMNIKSKFIITMDQYHQLFKNQNNKCAICGDILKKAHIDHDHNTGEIRGILCSHCNVGLGYFKENKLILESAINYIHNYPQLNKNPLYAKRRNNKEKRAS